MTTKTAVKRDSRKVEIMKTAAHVFLELGYDGTSMNVVAERAQVTKPGLYYHFASKQDLLFAIMSYAMDALERETWVAAEAATGSVDRLRSIIYAHARLIAEEVDGGFTMLVIDETKVLADDLREIIEGRKREYYATIQRALRTLESEGKLLPLDPTVATFSILGMILWLTKWFRKDGRLSGEVVARQVTDMALAAVLVPDCLKD